MKITKNKKIIALFCIGTLLILTIMVGVSYAIWTLSRVQDTDNIVNIGCFEIEFTEDVDSNIELTNTYSITDEMGMATIPYTFSVENTCTVDATYQVNLEVLDTTTLDASLIKVSLNDSTPEILDSYKSASSTITGADSYSINPKVHLVAGETKSHSLRVWVGDNSTLENSQNKSFRAKIVVTAVPKTEITLTCNEYYASKGVTETSTEYFTYENDGDGVKVTGYSDLGPKDVVIPCELDNKPVVSIGMNAFNKGEISIAGGPPPDDFGYSLTSAVIPNTVTTIEGDFNFSTQTASGAFMGNLFTSVDIPDSVVTVGPMAFFSNKLISINIPDSVLEIGAYAFSFHNATSIELGNSLKNIGIAAFTSQNTTVENLILPESLETVGFGAFSYLNTQYLEVHNLDVSLEEFSLAGNSFNFVKLIDNVAVTPNFLMRNDNAFKDSFNSDSIVILGGYGNTVVPTNSWNSFDGTVIIDKGIVAIEETAFSNSRNLELFISTDVVRIEKKAFFQIENLNCSFADVTLEMLYSGSDALFISAMLEALSKSKLEYIGDNAFDSANLNSFQIPKGVVFIGNNAFANNQIDTIFVFGKSSEADFEHVGVNWNGIANVVYQPS